MSKIDINSRILDGLSKPVQAEAPAQPQKATQESSGTSFSDVLKNQLSVSSSQANIKFSGHAQTRLASRGIELTGEDVTKLGDAITRAAAKGARSSLVLMDKAALVVSVPNRTVITAVDQSALKENIFTNIDSAMIL